MMAATYIFLCFLHFSFAQRITFPDEVLDLPMGSACWTSSNVKATCQSLASCASLQSGDAQIKFYSMRGEIVVCCPELADASRVKQSPIRKSPNRKISAPILYWDPIDCFCGSPYNLARTGGYLVGTDQSDSVATYHLNETADELKSKGFSVKVTAMYGDAIYNMTYTNGTFSGQAGFAGIYSVLAVGGKPAPEQMAFFMALLGEKHGDKMTWFCDGVVLNREWILSAAHCFAEPSVDINIIRLGDYDWNRTDEKWGNFPPYDVGIADVIIHPEYDANNGYNDIVLVKIRKPFPMFAEKINPICLPWDDHTGRNIVGYNVTLSGWGATSYNSQLGQKHPILQAVELNVFDVSVCQRGYSTTNFFRFKWPKGMTSDKILCAGWPEGGRDACKGDSGGPLTYLDEDTRRFTLAGIVQGGHGCGLKEFPGIYIPINNPDYLEWIKEIAFKGFVDSASNDYLTNRRCYISPSERVPDCV